MKIVRLIFILAAISFILSPANAISIYGDGRISRYLESSEIRGNDLIVTLAMNYNLHTQDNSIYFSISPGHGAWHGNIQDFNGTIYEGCTPAEPQLPSGIKIDCTTVVAEIPSTEKNNDKRDITLNISPTNSFREFTIIIKYKIPNFIRRVGSTQIAWFNHYGDITDFDVFITFPSDSVLITEKPDTAKLNTYDNRPLVWLEEPGSNIVHFVDTNETEKWTPFWWSVYGAVIGLFLERIFGKQIKKFLELLKRHLWKKQT